MKIKVYFIFFILLLLSCNKKANQTIIKGDLTNLPDGVLYLYKDVYDNRIDSAITKNGKFLIEHNWVNGNDEPVYLGLDHIDKTGVLRTFSFITNSKFKGSGYNSNYFFSDSIVTINGIMTQFDPSNIKLSEKVKMVVGPKIISGYQTNALFHIDGDLFDNINKGTYNKVLSKIKEYPNSFHLLYEINNNRNSFTPSQTKFFLNSFKGKIVNSVTFKNLKDYNEKRYNKTQLNIPPLLNEKGEKTEILDTKFYKHLVVFWASWCGPCRQEIPLLKKMHLKYKNNFEFVSISTDEKNASWKNALDKEQMSWKQLIVSEESKEFEPIEIFFQLSPSIPYIVLVDNNMKVVKSHVGLITEIELENFLKE